MTSRVYNKNRHITTQTEKLISWVTFEIFNNDETRGCAGRKIGFCKQEDPDTFFIADDTATYRYRITEENLMI
jgi:hypothetical protein